VVDSSSEGQESSYLVGDSSTDSKSGLSKPLSLAESVIVSSEPDVAPLVAFYYYYFSKI
jgi:hypothetical protein